jgi:chemotaxis signal transduction protein
MTDTVGTVLSEAARLADEWRHERMLRVLVFRRGDDLYGVPLGFLSEVIPARSLTRVPVLGRQWQGLFFARGMCHGLIAIPGAAADEGNVIRMMIVLKSPERCGLGATEVLGHFVLPHQKLEPDRSAALPGDLATFGVFEWEETRVRVLDIPETLRRAHPAPADHTSNEPQASSGTEPLMQSRIGDDR